MKTAFQRANDLDDSQFARFAYEVTNGRDPEIVIEQILETNND